MTPTAPGLPPAAAAGWRVLVVDDHHDAASTLAILFELAGHEVRIAHDGLQALDMAHRFAPQVGILDISLPRLDGHELARRLRREPPQPPRALVALSGWAAVPSDDGDFDACLVKPVDFPALLALLATLMAPR